MGWIRGHKKAHIKWASSAVIFYFFVDARHQRQQVNSLRFYYCCTVFTVAYLPPQRYDLADRIDLGQGGRILGDKNSSVQKKCDKLSQIGCKACR